MIISQIQATLPYNIKPYGQLLPTLKTTTGAVI